MTVSLQSGLGSFTRNLINDLDKSKKRVNETELEEIALIDIFQRSILQKKYCFYLTPNYTLQANSYSWIDSQSVEGLEIFHQSFIHFIFGMKI